MKSLIRGFIVAFSKYSFFPKTEVKDEKVDYQYILIFIPLVGLLIGGVLFGWGFAQPYLCNEMVFPAVMGIVIPTIISGGSHIEGFIKTVDALSAHKPRDKKMEIMADAHGGYNAIIVCVCYYLIGLGIWSEMPVAGITILALGFILTRCLFGLSILTLRHAQESKCTNYIPESKTVQYFEIFVLALFACGCSYVMVMLRASVGLACVLGALVTFVYYWFICYKHFDGITEDTSSFFLQLCEVVIPFAALLAYKRWW